MAKQKVVLSSDHAGFELKEDIKSFLVEQGHEVEDVGTFGLASVDYPDYTRQAVEKVTSGAFPKAVLFCGTGIGTCIAANKVPGIRAAVCLDTFTAELSRAHNDANVLVLGGWLVGKKLARQVVTTWLGTPFEGGRHAQRLKKVTEIEREGRLRRGKTYDISRPIVSGMLTWPTDARVVIESAKSISQGKSSNVSRMDITTHTGTHIDAPRHYIDGALGVDDIHPEVLAGAARVCQIDPQVERIDEKVLRGFDLDGVYRVLFRTANSALWKKKTFSEKYVCVSEGGASYLAARGMRLVGIDYLSIEEFHNRSRSAHRVLLKERVVILEGIDLSKVPAGDYELLCLPLRVKDGDGAPVRAFLREI